MLSRNNSVNLGSYLTYPGGVRLAVNIAGVTAYELGVPAPSLHAAKEMYAAAKSHGWAEEDFTSYTIGLGWVPFLWTNRWRVNGEIVYLPQAMSRTLVEPRGMLGLLAADTGSQWAFRTQFQFGF